MSVDRHVPMVGQCCGGAYVIEMAVREHNAIGRRAKCLLRPAANDSTGERQTRIDQRPGAILMGNAEHIDKHDAQTLHSGRDVIKIFHLLFRNRNQIHTKPPYKWDAYLRHIPMGARYISHVVEVQRVCHGERSTA